MPTGTRKSISANSTTKPRIATASVLKCGIASLDRLDLVLAAKQFRMEDQPVVRTAISSTADTSPIQATRKNGHTGRRKSKVSTLSW